VVVVVVVVVVVAVAAVVVIVVIAVAAVKVVACEKSLRLISMPFPPPPVMITHLQCGEPIPLVLFVVASYVPSP